MLLDGSAVGTGVGPEVGPGIGTGAGAGVGPEAGAGLGSIEGLKAITRKPRVTRTTPSAKQSINRFERLIPRKREAALARRPGLVASI